MHFANAICLFVNDRACSLLARFRYQALPILHVQRIFYTIEQSFRPGPLDGRRASRQVHCHISLQMRLKTSLHLLQSCRAASKVRRCRVLVLSSLQTRMSLAEGQP